MRVNLKVPFEERHEAKKRGARWDPARKTWFVEDMAGLEPLLRWMPAHLTKPVGAR